MQTVIAIAGARLGETEASLSKLEEIEKHLSLYAPMIVRRFAVLVELLLLCVKRKNKEKISQYLKILGEIVEKRGMDGKSEAAYVNTLFGKYLNALEEFSCLVKS